MKIEKYLVLNRYLLSLFGVDEFKELQNALADKREEIPRGGVCRSPCALDGLTKADCRKTGYLSMMSKSASASVRSTTGGSRKILKYFQYLALLFTEIVSMH